MKRNDETILPIAFEDKTHEALVSVWWTGVLLRRAFPKLFGAHMRSEAQFNVLMVLKDAGKPLRQSEIASSLVVDKANVTGLIDAMEADGLVKRKDVAGDRRSHHVALTAKGRSAIAGMEKLYLRRVHEIMSDLKPNEEVKLIELTRKLRQGVARVTRTAGAPCVGPQPKNE